MILRFVRREPDKAYISNMLWLPRRAINIISVKTALQYFVIKDRKTEMRILWEETQNHLIVPRDFIPPKDYEKFKFPFIDLMPKKFPKSGITTNIELSEEKGQLKSWPALKVATGGVLNLAPGKGKTVLALKKLEASQVPGLIIVHNTYLMEQWKKSISKFIEMPAGESLGIIQGPVFNWQHPITLAMIDTLALRAQEGKIPLEFSSHFGVVFFDEVHHLSAPHFVQTAPLVSGQRYGLTATPERTDGMEYIYLYHIGRVFYSDMISKIQPKVFFQQTPSHVDLKDDRVLDRTGELHIGRLRNVLTEFPEILKFRGECIQEALNEKRKVLAIGHSKTMLVALSERFDGSCVLIAETPQEERIALVNNSPAIFAIGQLGVEGLDNDEIDGLFFLTPFKNPGEVTQSFGRLQRPYEGKRVPVVVVFDDIYIPPLHALCNKLRKVLVDRKIPYQTLEIPAQWVPRRNP